MASFIVCFHKPEDVNMIRNFLGHSGYVVACSCMSGARALEACDKLEDGIVICGYRLSDMLCLDLYDSLPKAFRMLVMCSPQVWEYAPPKGLEVLDMPVRAAELRARVSSLEEDFTQWREQERRRKGKRRLPRDPQEEALILEAKALLEQKRSMGEAEAHRYLQKLAMDTGVSLPEAAAKVKVSFQSR